MDEGCLKLRDLEEMLKRGTNLGSKAIFQSIVRFSFCSIALFSCNDWKVSQEPQHVSSGKFWLKSDPDGAFRFLFLHSALPEVSLFILP